MNPFFYFSPLILQTIVWPFTKVIFGFFGRLQIRGRENIRRLPKGVIFAANHSSELDPILVPASLSFLSRHFPMFYTSRERDFYKTSGWRKNFYGGFFFKIWGAHPVLAGKQNYELSLKTHLKILNSGKGKSLCIFPEGKKTRDGKLGEARGGTAYLAHKMNFPVVPIYIGGIFQMKPSQFWLRKRKITVSFGKPLYPRDLFKDTQNVAIEEYKQASQKILDEIKKLDS